MEQELAGAELILVECSRGSEWNSSQVKNPPRKTVRCNINKTLVLA